MKVAIMGAGLSGLACAIILERNGIIPTIFESRKEVDDRFVNGEIFLDALNAPIEDAFAYLSNEFQIYLQPVGHIKKLIIYSENEQAITTGDLGFNVARGRREDSLCKQLLNQLNTEIVYNSKHTYEELLKEFTHIVVATGDGAYSEKMGNYKRDFTVSLKGAIVEGEFDRYTTKTWLDNTFAPSGYTYLIPLSNTEANIVIAYPDYQKSNRLDGNVLWENFFTRVQRDLKQTLKITDGFEIAEYIIGHCNKPRIGNTFFVGNCYGAIMPFLGFGQFPAIMTGIYAAYDLCGKGNYEKLVKNLNKSYENALVLRKAMEKLDNKKFDILVRNLNGFVGNTLLDYKKIDFLNVISNILKPIINTDVKNNKNLEDD
ncbi:MAG: NAD(P)/FAD-dependent oxidoreductase [Clostridiaceae bacterium]|nr:NAD(P)/FAD-dependent oxidoreductase [Clostridiaceae bacterium]